MEEKVLLIEKGCLSYGEECPSYGNNCPCGDECPCGNACALDGKECSPYGKEYNSFRKHSPCHRGQGYPQGNVEFFLRKNALFVGKADTLMNQMSTRDRRSSRGTAYCHQCHILDWPVTGVFPETPNWCLNEDVCRRVGDNAPTNWISRYIQTPALPFTFI